MATLLSDLLWHDGTAIMQVAPLPFNHMSEVDDWKLLTSHREGMCGVALSKLEAELLQIKALGLYGLIVGLVVASTAEGKGEAPSVLGASGVHLRMKCSLNKARAFALLMPGA